MKQHRYAIAVISFFDNDNKCFLVTADSEIEAMKKALTQFRPSEEKEYIEWLGTITSVEQMKDECLNGEIGISAPILID